jgi:S-adenosylmethionine synthetase
MSSTSLFTSESVSEGHPDKVSDQISDAILDALLEQDPNSRVAVETLVTTGLAVVSGEVTTNGYVDVQEVTRDVIKEIGYTKASYRFDSESCGVITTIHKQSPDIAMGVDREGAGDQGIMFGYATRETPELMPMTLQYSHDILKKLASIRKETSLIVHTLVVSTQHDEDVEQAQIQEDIIKNVFSEVIPSHLMDDDLILHINPTGKFVIGGPHGDTGLTGRKIIVDTYGGRGAHGGGAFSGKDPSKVDRSAAYAARNVAKTIVAAELADECLVQLSYAIGVVEPISVHVDTNGTGKASGIELSNAVKKVYDLTPSGIIKAYDLKRPMYRQTAAYGHFGRDEFPWEKVTKADELHNAL